MTKFSFEAPIAHLEDFEDLQDFHFTLSMLYSDERYKKFYKEQSLKGEKTIWLDNSYNEQLNADKLEALVEIAEEVGVQKVISPDSPKWSIGEISTAFQEATEAFRREELIVVISSLDMHAYLKLEGALHFAVSYWNRPKMQSILEKLLPCHFLGLLSIPELLKYHPPTCDTSMPIKLALRGMLLRDWAAKDYPHIYTHELGEKGGDFFHTKMTKEQVALARRNILRLKEVCNEE